MYKDVFWKSFRNLKFSLFIPDIYFMFIDLVLAYLFFKFTGISTLFENPEFIASGIEEKLPLLLGFLSTNFIVVLAYFGIFVLTSFILGSSLNCMRFGMIRDVVKGQKYNFKKVFGYGIKFWPVVWVRMIVFFLGVIALLFNTGAYIMLKTYYPLAPTVFIVTALGIGAVFFLKLIFLFTYAVMFIEKKGAFSSVRDSFVYFFKNKAFVIKVFIIVILFSIFLFPFEYVFIHYENVFGLISFYAITFLVIRNLASAFYTVWSQVLIFYSYESKPLSPSGPSQQQSP